MEPPVCRHRLPTAGCFELLDSHPDNKLMGDGVGRTGVAALLAGVIALDWGKGGAWRGEVRTEQKAMNGS